MLSFKNDFSEKSELITTNVNEIFDYKKIDSIGRAKIAFKSSEILGDNVALKMVHIANKLYDLIDGKGYDKHIKLWNVSRSQARNYLTVSKFFDYSYDEPILMISKKEIKENGDYEIKRANFTFTQLLTLSTLRDDEKNIDLYTLNELYAKNIINEDMSVVELKKALKKLKAKDDDDNEDDDNEDDNDNEESQLDNEDNEDNEESQEDSKERKNDIKAITKAIKSFISKYDIDLLYEIIENLD